jgi:hypothetical protein
VTPTWCCAGQLRVSWKRRSRSARFKG